MNYGMVWLRAIKELMSTNLEKLIAEIPLEGKRSAGVGALTAAIREASPRIEILPSEAQEACLAFERRLPVGCTISANTMFQAGAEWVIRRVELGAHRDDERHLAHRVEALREERALGLDEARRIVLLSDSLADAADRIDLLAARVRGKK